MKTIIRFKYFFLSMIVALAIGCNPEDGEDGAIGPQGEKGIQGAQGPQGEQGEKGTANVMYSAWLDQDFSWIDNDKFKGMLVDESRLTNDFFNQGGIALGFFRFQERVQENLPYESFNRNTRRSMTAISFEDRGEVLFSLESTDGTDLTEDEVNGVGATIQAQFKYVLIPGGTLLTGRSQQLDFEKMTYYEVMDHFGLDY